MKKCSGLDCGALWLDPMPVEGDLPKLYANYYTHQEAALAPSAKSALRAFSDQVRVAYLHARYGYEPASSLWMNRCLRWVVYAHPVWKDSLDASVFYLPAKRSGRLLELGCGSGASLKWMEQRGWKVTGLDFDEKAVQTARRKDLDVRHGHLAAQEFADERFDAVIMSHVIEHIPSPIELLAECRRVLKKGGHLVALTPNANSRLHKRYGRNWRGLETPRHLQIFTPQSLARIANKAGYAVVETFTSMNGFVYQDLASAELARGKRHLMGRGVAPVRRIISHIRGLMLRWLHVASPGRGEELVLLCKK